MIEHLSLSDLAAHDPRAWDFLRHLEARVVSTRGIKFQGRRYFAPPLRRLIGERVRIESVADVDGVHVLLGSTNVGVAYAWR